MASLPEMPPGWPYTGQNGRKRRARRNSWSPKDKAEFRRMWNAGDSAEEIADRFSTSRGAVYARAYGDSECTPRSKRSGSGQRRGKRLGDASKQRRFRGVVHEEGKTPKIVLAPHHPAYRNATTFFPSTVIPASKLPRLLKSGENSRKIGRRVSKGRWSGFDIYTLTREERETCPRSCREWATCYGNNMPFAQRIFDDGTLLRRLWSELAALNAEHPAGFVVRLHVLGDFDSRDYVRFWAEALCDFPALNIFGFTARLPSDPIGADLLDIIAAKWDRFCLRISGGGYETHCAEVVDQADQATGLLCPAQRDEKRSCATCGLCWATDRTISFLRH